MRYGASAAWAVLGVILAGFLFGAGCGPALPLTGPGDGAWPDRLPLVLPTSTPAFRLDPFRAPTPLPSATPIPSPQPRKGPLLWIGGEGSLTVLSPEGWRTFQLPGIVHDIAIDAQGNAILAPGLRMCDGRLLRDLLPRAPGADQDAVAIDPQGRIWAGYYGGIAVLEGGRWHSITLEGPARMVRDLAIDTQGVIWVATEGGLARFDGASWQHYGQDTGLGASPVECIMVDERDRIWVGHDKGVSVLHGTAWEHFPLETVSFVRGLAGDSAGHILAGSLYHGVSIFDGMDWGVYAERGHGLPSNRVTALAVDGLGRTWVGTRLGLSVHDLGRWLTYQEANSALGDNHVSALAVGGGALALLPTPGPKRYGRLVGRVTLGQQPVVGARVMLCSELSLAQGFGDNPCENAPLGRVVRTAADGSYAFEWVPAGHYAVTAEVEPGRWIVRTRVLSAVRYQVREGETTVAETIEGEE